MRGEAVAHLLGVERREDAVEPVLAVDRAHALHALRDPRRVADFGELPQRGGGTVAHRIGELGVLVVHGERHALAQRGEMRIVLPRRVDDDEMIEELRRREDLLAEVRIVARPDPESGGAGLGRCTNGCLRGRVGHGGR